VTTDFEDPLFLFSSPLIFFFLLSSKERTIDQSADLSPSMIDPAEKLSASRHPLKSLQVKDD
jgi:hypothetical protein